MFAFRYDRPLDLGLAFRGGEEAWATGHPERLTTWMSTPFLAMVMALVSRGLSLPTAMSLMTALNVALACGLVAVVWRELRGHLPRGWWWATMALALLYAPLVSSVLFKQFNLVCLALGLAGFAAARAGRPSLSGALVALSIGVKPVLVLLPLALLSRRETRAAGAWCLGWGAAIAAAAQGFLALRAHDVAALSPLVAFESFGQKTTRWICHPENFSPQGLLCRLMGVEAPGFQRLVVAAGVALLIVMAFDVTKGRRADSWEVFAFVCLLSPLVSPVSWTHYQLFLAPMLLLLVHRFLDEGASAARWAGLLAAYALADLVLRPLDSVPGVIRGLATGYEESRPELLRFLAVSQFAPYVLFLTAYGWFSRGVLPAKTTAGR